MKTPEVVENKIYRAVIGICEGREHNGSYKGNGHHLAQELCRAVSIELLAPQQRKIYDALHTTPQSTKQIAVLVNMEPKKVSAQLRNIDNYTLLISSNKKGKLRYWYKHS